MQKLENQVINNNQKWILDILSDDFIQEDIKQHILQMLSVTSVDKIKNYSIVISPTLMDEIAEYLFDNEIINYIKCSKCGAYFEPSQDVYVLDDDQQYCTTCWKKAFPTDFDWSKFIIIHSCDTIHELLSNMTVDAMHDLTFNMLQQAGYHLSHNEIDLMEQQEQEVKIMNVLNQRYHIHAQVDWYITDINIDLLLEYIISLMTSEQIEDTANNLVGNNVIAPYYTQV